MKKIIIAPDSFKGTMDAHEVCQVISCAVKKFFADAEIRSIPLADGGEGMVEAYIKLLGGERRSLCVSDPFGNPIQAVYGVLLDGTAVIEMASCAGLPLVREKNDPLHASTAGVGQMIKSAAAQGAENILIGIGGSATNDCGIGMAAELGYRFFGSKNEELEPLACNLGEVSRIEKPESLPAVKISVACDVNNPLCGINGATYVFGRQKGISEFMLASVDETMGHFADIIERDLGVSIKTLSGSGAAGGMGAAMVAFLGAQLNSGIDLLLDAIGFDDIIKDADMIITGEGRIDGQSATGKVPVGVGLRAKRAKVPCIALCGAIGPQAELVYDYGITAMFSSVKDVATYEDIRENCTENLRFLSESVMKTLVVADEDVSSLRYNAIH